MIAPLGQLSLTGAAWYQGEADVGTPGYAQRLTGMMSDGGGCSEEELERETGRNE